MVLQPTLGRESTIILDQATIIFMRMYVMIVAIMCAQFGQAHSVLDHLVQRLGSIPQNLKFRDLLIRE